jgi:hypothetical protein
VCACSISYPARNAHTPYCHLWPISLYHIFPHYLINGKIFEWKLNIKWAFWFSPQCLLKTFLITRRIQQDITMNVQRSSCEIPISLVRFLMKFEFPWQTFERCSNIKFHENLFCESRVVPCGRTDKPDKWNNLHFRHTMSSINFNLNHVLGSTPQQADKLVTIPKSWGVHVGGQTEGQTDRHNEANRRSSKFCENA